MNLMFQTYRVGTLASDFAAFLYLPPAYVVRGKVMFWHPSVCLSTFAGGVSHPRSGWGGYPIPGLARRGGTPSQVWPGGGDTPSQVWPEGGGGTPSQVWPGGGDTPSQVWLGGYPIPGLDRGGTLGTPLPSWLGTGSPWPGMGYPLNLGWGTPLTWDGVPPPPDLGWGTPQPGTGYPPDLGQGTPQPGMGYPPRPGAWVSPPDLGLGTPQDLGPGTSPLSIASTWYVAGGMPLAFTQEDFLVQLGGFTKDLN